MNSDNLSDIYRRASTHGRHGLAAYRISEQSASIKANEGRSNSTAPDSHVTTDEDERTSSFFLQLGQSPCLRLQAEEGKEAAPPRDADWTDVWAPKTDMDGWAGGCLLIGSQLTLICVVSQ
jgi:hypothetical protein